MTVTPFPIITFYCRRHFVGQMNRPSTRNLVRTLVDAKPIKFVNILLLNERLPIGKLLFSDYNHINLPYDIAATDRVEFSDVSAVHPSPDRPISAAHGSQNCISNQNAHLVHAQINSFRRQLLELRS